MADRFNILLVGHGRLGQLIAAAAPTVGATVVGTIDDTNAADLADRDRWRDVDVAIDVSAPEAFVANLPRVCALGCSLVVGTTGWQAHDAEVRRLIGEAGIGAVVTANFSVGATLMDALTERAARLFAPQELYGAFVHETHHAAKKDAPSGTAIMIERAAAHALGREIAITSVRTGHVPGTHELLFDGPFEQLRLTHEARDRRVFADGALVAARWLASTTAPGVYTMQDVLSSEAAET
jgi:4-hydroxy-tetrahydrodipicolinate reductase